MIAHIRFTKFLAVTVWMLLFSTIALAQYEQNQLRYPGDSLGLTIRGGSCINWGWEYNFQEYAVSVSSVGNRNTYLAWSERGEIDWRIRGAAVDSNGNVLWIRTINDHTNHQDYPVVLALSDGCIVAWVDYRNGILCSIYTQKMLANGTSLWPTIGDTTEGLLITESENYRYSIRMISDGNDGAILVWEDYRRGLGADLWGTRILSNGQLAPGFRVNGTPIAVAAAHQPYDGDYSICSDGRGGVWVVWVDNRTSGDPNLFLQRLRSDGTLQFDSTGQILIDVAGEQSKIDVCSDDRDGVFIVWRNAPPGEQNVELYMQRIDSSGTPRWNPGNIGVPLTNIVGNQTNPRVVASGVDTCIVAWEDFRTDPEGNTNEDIYSNKVTGTNSLVKLWGENGTPVCVEQHHQRSLQITSDDNRGIVVTWEDERGDSSPMQDIYAQRINSYGQPLWDVTGRPVANAIGGQYLVIPKLVGNDRFLFLWQDSRNGSGPIYRTVWSGTGQPTMNFPVNGVLTIPDISFNCDKVSVLSNETDRFITTWIDGRSLPFGYRVYYSVNNSITGEPIGCELHGNPVTLDSNNQISQQGGQQFSSPLFITTPDQGAIVIYTQTAAEFNTLRGQKISRIGERTWGNFGSQISSIQPCIDNLYGVPDGNGGVLFCYTAVDLTSPYFYNKVRLQHVSSTGSSLLPLDGSAIDSSDREQSYSCVTKSGENYYVGYTELYDEFNYYYAIHVAKVNLQGEVIWNRVYADSARNQSTGNRMRLRLTSASQGGVIAYWQEYRTDANNDAQIYAQRIDSLGNALWVNGGVRLGTSSMDQSNADAIQSGSNYWFVWQDVRNVGTAQIYCQRVSETGTLFWQSGHPLHSEMIGQLDPKIVAGRSNSVYVFWTQYIDREFPDESRRLPYGVHLDENGLNADPITWNGTNGVGYLSATNGFIASAVSDSYGGAIVGINRLRLHMDANLVVAAQRIYDRTCVDVKEVVSEALPSVYSLEQNFPNPFNGETKFRFTLPVSGVVKVTIFDVMGREVVTPVHRQFQAGTFDVHWNGKSNTGVKVSSGVYFYRIEAGKYVSTKKMVMVQ